MTLQAGQLFGMWAALPVVWKDANKIDEEAIRENIRRIAQAGVHGTYTHGTTGEFYAQSEREWEFVASVTIEESRRAGLPVQIGCTALWTGEVIRRVRLSRQLGADAVQIAFPFWLPLTDEQALRFLLDIASAEPGMPIVLYNTERSKKPLTAELLSRIVASRIPLIGCKGVQNLQELQQLAKISPQVRFFVGEAQLASGWKYGAQGSYSALVMASPAFMLRYFQMCQKQSGEAYAIEGVLQRFSAEWVQPLWERGLFDTALDRIIASSTGFLTGSLLYSRPPYNSPTLEDVEECRLWFAKNLPQFIEYFEQMRGISQP